MREGKEGREVSEVSRRHVFDHLSLSNLGWSGRLSNAEFLERMFDLSEMRSTDHRYVDAAGDIYQHTVRNNDWDRDWVFTDARFQLLRGPSSIFLRFLCETVHPIVRPSMDEAAHLVDVYNDALASDGWRIVEDERISGHPTFAAVETSRAVFEREPTGWTKVDRQVAEMRTRFESAGTEEQYQAVGLLSREVLISAALEVFVPSRHETVDGVSASLTDAKRMLEAVLVASLPGSSNDAARRQVRSAVDLALSLQHKRLADFRTTALCVEATCSVVAMIAIMAGLRDRRGADRISKEAT